uniref:Zona pellucida sperm-binding protein 3 receptor n=1 Tax=Zeugodacus cucurbitae TaxID=28588 RepID=A0A0A1WMI6_ZEUCU
MLAIYIYTAQEIKIKIHNFTNKYSFRQEKQKIGPSGGSPSTWKLYEVVHQAVGGYKNFSSAELVENSIEGDIEAIYLEAEIEGESPLPSLDADPSTSGSSTWPSSNEANIKKKTAVMVMEEIRYDFLKATEVQNT